MYDVLTIAALADELTATILDGRIQIAGLVDPRTVALEIYAGRRVTLLASAADTGAGLRLTERPPAVDPELVTPFVLLLRKYVRGGILVGIEQPPLERLVRFSIAKRRWRHNATSDRGTAVAEASFDPMSAEEADEETAEGLADATFVHLVVEIMGRHSNLILVDDQGRVMDAVKRVTPRMSRVRPVLPHLPYTDPPALDRPDPRRITTGDAGLILRSEPAAADLSRVLVRRLRGISPQMAREIAFRVTGTVQPTIGSLPEGGDAAVARETRRLLEPLLTSAWAPRVYRDGEGDAVAFAPIPLGHLAATHREEEVASISAAAELVEGETPRRHAQRRERLVEAVRSARERVEARLASLRQEQDKAADADRFRRWGELIYAHLWSLTPGQTELEASDERIPLDPSLSPKENARAYFERYRKAQGATTHLPELIARAETEAGYLAQLTTLVEQADAFADLEALRAEWEGYRGRGAEGDGEGKRGGRRPAPPRRPKPLLDAHGNAVYVGRSGAQNDAVTFDIAGPNDTWLHARGVPGSHVVVKWHSAAADEEDATIEAAAALAAFYSSGRGSGRVEVDVARRRFVRKIKGAGPGMVTYRNERTVAVRPLDEAGVLPTLRPS